MSIYKAKLSIKLDEENFLIWRLLVEPVIKGHRLHKFLTDSLMSPNAGSVNGDWDETDQILFSWILSTLSESMLRRVIGCKTSKQLWDELHDFFKTRARAKVGRYRSELGSITKKSTESVSEYLLRIKILIDSLDFAERPVNLQEHIDAILEGLPKEYEPSVKCINARSVITPCTVQEIEYMLLVCEAWIEEKSKVQNNKSDEFDLQSPLSYNGDNILGPPPPIPLQSSMNSFLQRLQHINPSNSAAVSTRFLPPAWTSPPTLSGFHAPMNMRPPITMPPHPQPPLPPLSPSNSTASAIPNQTTDLSFYAPPPQ